MTNSIDFLELKRRDNKVEFKATDEQIKQLGDAAHDLLCLTDAVENVGDFLSQNATIGVALTNSHAMAFGTVFKELGESMRRKGISHLASVCSDIYPSAEELKAE